MNFTPAERPQLGGLPERIIGAVFKTADDASPIVRPFESDTRHQTIKSIGSGEQGFSDPFRFANVRPLHGGMDFFCFFAPKARADQHVFGRFCQSWPAHFIFHTFV